MSDLLDLARRCEEAGGANFALELEIAKAVGFDLVSPPLAFTASLDAAMTLVPEGAFWSITMLGDKPGFAACCQAEGSMDWREAATAPLALCAAALRARAAVAGEGRVKP